MPHLRVLEESKTGYQSGSGPERIVRAFQQQEALENGTTSNSEERRLKSSKQNKHFIFGLQKIPPPKKKKQNKTRNDVEQIGSDKDIV